ncbi:hypothetical protein BG004_002518 [Podila humilis]|nr:hypothetical protein BG004_002518 [Podila humilis]
MKSSSVTIELDTILRDCPALLHLFIRPATWATFNELQGHKYPEVLPLRSLVLETILLLPVSTVQAIASRCPRLRKLHLIDLCYGSYPNSNRLRDASNVLQGNIKTGSSVGGVGHRSKQFDYDAAGTAKGLDRLTTLIIEPSNKSPTTSSALHHYLCHAPQLLHLYTSRERIQFAELKPEKHSDFVSTKIWACRRLKTLHMYFADTKPRSEVENQEINRWLFAYLTVLCPQLRELSFGHSRGLGIKMASGLCLLSRLADLERLEIHTSDKHELNAMDISWMAAPSHTLQLTEMQTLNRQSVLSRLRKASAPGMDLDTHPLWDQIALRCSTQNMVRQLDLLANEAEGFCWPRLEQLCIRRSKDVPMSPLSETLLQDLRPAALIAPLPGIEDVERKTVNHC